MELRLDQLDDNLVSALKLLKRHKNKALEIFGHVRRHMVDSNIMTLVYGIKMVSRWELLSWRDKEILSEEGWDSNRYDAFSSLWERNDIGLGRPAIEKFIKDFLES